MASQSWRILLFILCYFAIVWQHGHGELPRAVSSYDNCSSMHKKAQGLKVVSGPLVSEVREESTLCLVSIRMSFPSEVLKSCISQPVYLAHHFMLVSKTEENRSKMNSKKA